MRHQNHRPVAPTIDSISLINNSNCNKLKLVFVLIINTLLHAKNYSNITIQ